MRLLLVGAPSRRIVLSRLWSSPRCCDLLARIDPEASRHVAMDGDALRLRLRSGLDPVRAFHLGRGWPRVRGEPPI